MLPGTDGLSLCRWIRERGDLPVIMLTARGDTADRIVGLELGADDYVTKPFSLEEVVARLRVILRRTGRGVEEPRSAKLTFADIEDLLGFTLPNLARVRPDWWTGTDATSAPSGHTDAWRLANRTARPNLLAQTVVFERAT